MSLALLCPIKEAQTHLKDLKARKIIETAWKSGGEASTSTDRIFHQALAWVLGLSDVDLYAKCKARATQLAKVQAGETDGDIELEEIEGGQLGHVELMRRDNEDMQRRLVGLLANPAKEDVQGKDGATKCDVCASAGLGSLLLLCSGMDEQCPHACHSFCLAGYGKLRLPEGDWFCESCKKKKGTKSGGGGGGGKKGKA